MPGPAEPFDQKPTGRLEAPVILTANRHFWYRFTN
jgi:hypothetical protein